LPWSSSVPRCRNVARSRIAAKPRPVTSGSRAVYVNSYEFRRYGWAGSLKFTIELLEWRTLTIQLDPGNNPADVQAAAGEATAASSTGTPPEQPNPTTYVVQPDDTLSFIARKFLGDTGRWQEIWDANRDTIDDPNQIEVGQVLNIPGGTTNTGAPEQTQAGAPF